MECDCRGDSACTATSTYCQDGTTYFDSVLSGFWPDLNSVVTGAIAVVGFTVYRLSQALPFLIRWPVRLLCSFTGLSSLWIWVSHLVGTLRGIQSLFIWTSRIWRFIVALLSKLFWVPVVFKSITGSLIYAKQCLESVLTLQRHLIRSHKDDQSKMIMDQSSGTDSSPPVQSLLLSRPVTLCDPGLRLLLLGPSGAGRTSLADALLGCREDRAGASSGPLEESTKRRSLVDGREVTVIDTPDLLGSSLGDAKRAKEALRGLQLASPGPHAVLLVIRAPGAAGQVDQDAAGAIRTILALFGEAAAGHVFTVLTHSDGVHPGCTLAQLLEVDAGGLRTALGLCGLRAELVDNSLDCPPEARGRMCRRLLERLAEMRALRGHFIHELQTREERIKEELLTDMSSVLAGKLGHI